MARPPGSPTRRHAVAGARQRAWNALRIFKVFTAAEIGPVADIGATNLQKYLTALRRAGYLKLERAKRNGQVCGHAVWRLLRPSGPRCPIVRSDGTGVYDPNQERLYPFAQEEPTDGTLDEHIA
jgi:hypothetical protein